MNIGDRKLHFLCTGRGTPTVLLESSGPANSLQYRDVLPVLGRETTTCAYVIAEVEAMLAELRRSP